MSAFETTAGIARASLRVLGRHRALLWFPMLSIAAAIGVVMLFLPMLPEASGAAGGLAFAALYFALELVSVFFTAALTCEALRALRGQPTSVAGGVGSAGARIDAIASYAAIESTVGLLLGAISRGQRPSPARHILGTGWSLVTYLALPVLVAERRGGYDSLVRAGRLFRRTWGETTLGELGFRILTANFLVIIVLLLAVLSRVIDEPLAVVLVVALAVAAGVLIAALQAIYRAALYIFAAEGVVPDDFDTPEMHRVWKVK